MERLPYALYQGRSVVVKSRKMRIDDDEDDMDSQEQGAFFSFGNTFCAKNDIL